MSSLFVIGSLIAIKSVFLSLNLVYCVAHVNALLHFMLANVENCM